MLTEDILLKFCSGDEKRPILNHPFNRGGFTYCSDGRIAIRIPEIKKYADNRTLEIEPIFSEIGFEKLSFDHFPELPPMEYVECPTCNHQTIEKDDASFLIGSKRMNLIYLYWMKELPEIKICINYKIYLSPLPFIFEKGQGLCMPMRKVNGQPHA